MMAKLLSQPKTIQYCGFFNHTGYGQSATSNVLALQSSSKYDVQIQCFHGRPDKASYDTSVLNILRSMDNKPTNDSAIQIYHCIPDMHRKMRSLNKRISFATYETFDPPKHWIKHLNRCHAVFVPSEFNYKTFKKAGLERPIFKIPHTINTDIWNDEITPFSSNEDVFTFLFVGTWTNRKGCKLLIEAFLKEFSISDNVRLLIKTNKTDQASKFVNNTINDIKKQGLPPIDFERKVFAEADMARFVKSAHCMVLPTMGEGFGLTGAQALAVKVPLIVTNFSGCKEYASEDNSTLIEPSGYLFEHCMDPSPQFIDKKWPRLKISDIQRALRFVFENYSLALSKADKGYEKIQKEFNYDTFIQQFDNMIESVYFGD